MQQRINNKTRLAPSGILPVPTSKQKGNWFTSQGSHNEMGWYKLIFINVLWNGISTRVTYIRTISIWIDYEKSTSSVKG